MGGSGWRWKEVEGGVSRAINACQAIRSAMMYSKGQTDFVNAIKIKVHF